MYCLLSFCCVCLNDREELQSLNTSDIDNIQLLDKLNFCAFENEWIQSNFPIFICYKCCQNLRIAYEFKKMCHKNNKLLRGYVNQLNVSDLEERPKLVQDAVVAQYCKTELDFASKIDNAASSTSEYIKQLNIEQCSFCSAQFNDKTLLDKHLLSHTSTKTHPCTICNKSFSRKLHLERHILSHTGNRTHHCNLCPKSFLLKSHLNGHMLTHSGVKSHNCELCNKNFARKSDLHRHMLIHTVEKTYKCNFCHKSFARKSHLARHMIFHSGKRPHSCTLCAKSFILKSHLNDHMLTHSGIKSHHCGVCIKSFGRKSDLNRHMQTHNNKTHDFVH